MSYARLTLITLGPGQRAKAEPLAEEMVPVVKALPGNQGATFLMDEENGEYGAFLLWDTKEHAEAAKEKMLPILMSKIGDVAKGPPSLKLFEVYEIKG